MRTQSAAKLLFIDALKLLVPTASVENIWQYQLFAACPNGDSWLFSGFEMIPASVTTLFIGTNFDLFKNSFANVTQLCSEGNATDYDLTNVYERVVSSVGKQQRGLIVFYHEMDEATTQKVTVNDTDAFIRRAQQYQQQVSREEMRETLVQMYVFNVFDSSFMPPSPITSELISALMSTGGNVVLGDYRAGLAPTDVNIKVCSTVQGEDLQGRNSLTNRTSHQNQSLTQFGFPAIVFRYYCSQVYFKSFLSEPTVEQSKLVKKEDFHFSSSHPS